jgi:hypothetical protein
MCVNVLSRRAAVFSKRLHCVVRLTRLTEATEKLPRDRGEVLVAQHKGMSTDNEVSRGYEEYYCCRMVCDAVHFCRVFTNVSTVYTASILRMEEGKDHSIICFPV